MKARRPCLRRDNGIDRALAHRDRYGMGGRLGTDPHSRRPAAGGRAAHFRRQERRPSPDDRLAPDPEPLMLENVPRLPTSTQLEPHPRKPRRRHRRRRQARARRHARPAQIHIDAGDIVDTTAPYELVSHDARELLGARAASCPLRRGQRLDARRLRDRHAPRRPASHGPQGARRRDRHRGGLCRRPRSQGA